MSEIKQIRFIDPQYNELFRIPEGGSIVITRPDGEMYPGVQEQWVGICEYLDDTHVSINGTCYHICQFAEIQQRIGATVMPEPDPEMIGGYRVTHRTFVRDLVFKLGHNPDAVQPYATWRCNKADPSNNYWGHYWSDRSTAHTDFFRRADAARTDTPYDHTVLMRQEQKPWMAVTKSNEHQWVEDEVYRLNGHGTMYYTGGEDGIYIRIQTDGTLEAGNYEGAIPHIGDATFMPVVTNRYESYSLAFQAAIEAGGKQFMADMFSGSELQTTTKVPQDGTPSLRETLAANAQKSKGLFGDQSPTQSASQLEETI